MLQESTNVRARLPAHMDLARVEAELDLTSTQLASWVVLVDTFEEVRDAVEALDVITGHQLGEHAPGLEEVLEIQAKCLAVRLGAVRRLHGAVARLGRSLTPRQRTRADRLLGIHFRDLALTPDRLN